MSAALADQVAGLAMLVLGLALLVPVVVQIRRGGRS
jgi:hypothetical protein